MMSKEVWEELKVKESKGKEIFLFKKIEELENRIELLEKWKGQI